MTYSIMTCGVGGQGLMLVSNIIGLTCAKFNLKIRTAETHGLAQRSGSIYTHIRIGEEVFSPLIPYGEANVLLGMEAIESLRYIEFLQPNGMVILNNYIWQPVQSTYDRVMNSYKPYIEFTEITSKLEQVTENLHIVNASELAEKAGHSLTSNVVLLGALAKVDGFPLALKQLTEAIPEVVPGKAIEANLRALELGYKALP